MANQGRNEMKRKLLSLSIALLIGCQAAHAYDRLGNMSTRGIVVPGPGGAMITGFIAQGTTEKCVVMRSRGPSMKDNLTPEEQDLVLDDPNIRVMRLISGKWTIVVDNDNWQEQEPEDVTIIQDLGLEPKDPLEAAVFLCLVPGAPYTVITRGPTNNDGGMAIVEGLDADPISEIQNTGCGQECTDLQDQIDSLQVQLDAIGPHTERYTDAEAVAAVGPHTNRYTNAEAVSAVGPHTERYTDAEAVSAVGPHFSGNHNDLSGVTANQHHTPSGGSSPVLDFLVLEKHNGYNTIVVQNANMLVRSSSEGLGNLIVGGNDLTGETFVRTGTNNLIVGSDHSWTGNNGLVSGQGNIYSTAFGAMLGGAANELDTVSEYSVIVGGSSNYIQAVLATVAGGENNAAKGYYSTLLGGLNNTVTSVHGVVVGN